MSGMSSEPAMKETSFAEMQEDDLPAVLDIYNHYIVTTTVTFDSDPISKKTLRTLWRYS